MAEFEERADQLTLEDIDALLVDSSVFQHARKKLLGPGAKLLEGPRGTGKTHVMRYCYLLATKQSHQPIALYCNFSRYLTLEPLLSTASDAIQRFHTWVIAKLLLSAFDFARDAGGDTAALSSRDVRLNEPRLRELVSLLERGSGGTLYAEYGATLTIDLVTESIRHLCNAFSRPRAVCLLDDAALSLTDRYLIEFFVIFRLLKTDFIAPKASVYPGTTQYGPTFHVLQETGSAVPLWLSVEDPEYMDVMGRIATKRLPASATEIGSDTLELYKYAAFGVPRAYLRLLREHLDVGAKTSQQRVNQVIEDHANLLLTEYDSLGIKLPQLAPVVKVGRRFFENVVRKIAHASDSAGWGRSRNITIGLQQDLQRPPLANRMLRFLVEVGLLYPLTAVSHGPERKYDRYIIHLAFLYKEGLFREGRRGTSPRDLAEYMNRSAAKHPVRAELSTLLTSAEIVDLKLALPPCGECKTPRINESQKFCHHCGRELVPSSIFDTCMALPLAQVPGISQALLRRIHHDTNVKTVGDVHASQNASTDLQQASYVGPIRAKGIIEKVALTVSEFLS